MKRIGVFLVVLLISTTVYAAGGKEGTTVGRSPAHTVRWFTHATVSQTEMYNTYIEKFENANPGVTVDLTVLSGWDELWRRILTSVAAGEPPTGARVKDFQVRDLARRNTLMDVSAMYDRDRESMQVDDYFESLVEPYYVDGGLYGLPWHVYYYILYYNVDLVRQAGLDRAPETWEEIIEVGRRITDHSNNVFGTQMMTYGGNDAFMTKTIEMFARSMSDDPLNDPWSIDEEIPRFNLTSPSMKKAVQLWLDMMYVDQIALPPELSVMPQRVENGLIAIWFTSQLGASDLRKRTDINYNIALMPRGPNRTTIVEQNGWAIFANTGNDEITWEFAKFVTSPEFNADYSRDGVYLPNRMTQWEMPPFNSDPFYLVAREQLSHPDTVFRNKYTDDWMRVMVPISAELENIFRRNKTVDQGLADAQRAAEAALIEIYGRLPY